MLDRMGIVFGADQSSLYGHDYLNTYEKLINSSVTDNYTLVIIGHKHSYKLAASIALTFETISVKLFELASVEIKNVDTDKISNLEITKILELGQADELLTALGPIDLLIEDGTNKRQDKISSFDLFFWHVKKDGFYVAEDLHAIGIPTLADGGGEDILSLVYNIGHDKRLPANLQTLTGVYAERRDSIESFTVTEKLLILKKKFTHFRKLSEDTYNSDINLKRLGNHLTKIKSHSASGSFVSRANFSVNKENFSNRIYDQIDYPEAVWRVYENVRVDPFSVVTAANSFLPETYRLFKKNYLSSFRVKDAGYSFGRSPSGQADSYLKGTYYHLDNEFIDQYGHTTTDVLAKVWAYSLAKDQYPDLKVLISATGEPSITSLKPWVLPFLNAAGIDQDHIVVFTKPTIVEKLIGATPLFSNLGFVHPMIEKTWSQVRENLAGMDTSTIPKRKIFISRGNNFSRGCQNSKSVESVFTSNGFELVYPEMMPLPEQAQIFASASAVAGYAGSGMINTFMCQRDIPKLIIASESYGATNEALISSVLGGDTHYIYCDAEIKQPQQSWSLAAHKSNFTFNFESDMKNIDKWLLLLDSNQNRIY